MRLAFPINAHQNANQKPIRSAPSYRAQCTLPPRPMCQTLLFNFSRVWFRDYPITLHTHQYVIQLRCTRTNTTSNYVAHAPIRHPITLHTYQYAIQLRCTRINTPSNYVAHAPIRHPITLHMHQYAIQLLVSEPDPRKIEKEGLAHRPGWKCTLRNVRNFINCRTLQSL